MSDPRRERLFQELWPTPEPPADLAARVTGTLAADAEARRPKPAVPAPAPRRRRAALVAIAAGVTAAAAGLVIVLGTPTDQELEGPAEGAVVARAHETVQIGNRGAAAMEPGADVTWAVRGKRARVKQRRGSVFYRVERGGPFRVSTPAGNIEVTGTSFRVTLGGAATGPAASTLVAVLEGSVKVETDRGMLAIRAGETALLAPGRLPEIATTAATAPPPDDALRERAESAEARLREIETELAESARADARRSRRAPLLLPFARDLDVFGAGLDEVSLALPTGRRAARVQVAHDAAFTRTVYSGPAEGFVTVPAPAKGSLYWRVASQPGAVAEARFGPDPGGLAATTHPHRADHLVTEGRASTTVYFQGAPPALTLALTADPAAARHRVRIYRAGALGRPIFDRVVTGARVAVEAGVLGEGRYVWSALPLDDRGHAQGGGRLNKLELAYDNALSGLAIAAPRPDQMTVPARPLDVIGVAPLGARLHVNGRPTPLDDKGRFTLRLPTPPRLLVFRLERKGAGESYWIRPLRRR